MSGNHLNENDGADEQESFNFESVHSDNFPGILKGLNISLVGTSYQSQKLFFVRTMDGGAIDVNFKTFRRPMGLAVNEQQITLGTHKEIWRFTRNDGVVDELQGHEKEKIDACFVPSASHVTGMINIHDIAYGADGLWVTNSNFSCLATIETDYSFVPRWKPPFVTELAPEDRCHLNGMALVDGEPRYVTCFNQSDGKEDWREMRHDGVLIDVRTEETLLRGLCLPHSPRCYQGKVYFCESGNGLLKVYDPETREVTVLAELQGFVRGMDFYGPLLFVGLSKIRASTVKNKVPLADKYETTYCGIWVINIEDGSTLGFLCFEGDVSQIYDVAVLTNCSYPELIEPDSELMPMIFKFPQLCS